MSLRVQWGRRPDGLVDDDREGESPTTIGAYFAELAHLEAASVYAFRTIADELVRFGAPDRLVQAARRARRDEIRHTRMTSALARRFGEAPRRPRVAPTGRRALVDFALENAVEGCVSETFGALVAHWQARHAEDREVRVAMMRIARDETQHASLSWRLHRWACSRLSATPVRTRGMDGLPTTGTTKLTRTARTLTGRRKATLTLRHARNLSAVLFEEDLHAKRVESLANGVAGVLNAAMLSVHAIGQAYAATGPAFSARSGPARPRRDLAS